MRSLDPRALRDAVLSSLASLPGTRDLQLLVLCTTPRRHSGLFPYANPRPRCLVQDVLLLLFERSPTPPADLPPELRDYGKVCVAAVEAFLYFLPSAAPEESAILYVSKVDSSGCGMHPSPVSAMTRAFLAYVASPSARPARILWIHVFARAQSQYLFPNSSENPGKRVLRDAQLCRWWKTLLEEVMLEVGPAPVKPTALLSPVDMNGNGKKNEAVASIPTLSTTTDDVAAIHFAAPPTAASPSYGAFYLLPGYSQLEAERLMPPPRSPPTASPHPPLAWSYSHPYASAHFPTPFAHLSSPEPSIATLIPYFDDDPKSRFVAELASDVEGVTVPKKRKPGGNSSAPFSPSKKRKSDDSGGGARVPLSPPPPARKHEPTGEERVLGRTTVDEFWELMPHRQECSSGAVTAFFVLVFRDGSVGGAHSGNRNGNGRQAAGDEAAIGIAGAPGQVAQAVFARVTSALLDLDYGGVERAYRASKVLEDLVQKHCAMRAPAPAFDAVPAAVEDGDTVQAGANTNTNGASQERVQGTRNGEAAPPPEQDMYTAYISASITLSNPPVEKKPEHPPAQPAVVNVLQVKKKKRPAVGAT